MSGFETPLSTDSRTIDMPLEDSTAAHSPQATPSKELKSSASQDGTLSNRFDLEKLLHEVVQRRKEADIPARQLGVMFENLQVTGEGASTSYAPTIGSMFNPVNWVEGIQNGRHTPIRKILTGFEGTVKPGEMLLVLGSPGSGCTTLLKTLANQRAEYKSIEGDVHYNSISPQDLDKHYRGDAIFCPEDDVHFPSLTVEQTIRFAARCRAPHQRAGFSKDQYVDTMTETLLKAFGLDEVRHTKVGDAHVRGVSGGQKKRVSICEALATRAGLISWDNTTRGLDSSTALEFIQVLRTTTDVFKLTSIASLYQVGQSLYDLFDKVCLIYEGRMVYYGPASEARAYFMDMGYEPANRQTTADFLVAVTDPSARTAREGLTSPLPRTAQEFAEYFQKSQLGRNNRAAVESYRTELVGKPDLATEYRESAMAEHANHSRKASPYTVSLPMQAKTVMVRRLQMLRGDLLVTGINMFTFIFQGVLMGTVFLKLGENTGAFFSRGGILFFVLLFSVLMTVSEIPTLFIQRPIILRHRDWALYHPFVDQIALFLVDIPITFVCVAILDVLVYMLSRFQQTAGQFFILLMFTFVCALVMKAYFRALTALCKDEATAQTFAGLSILLVALYTGYTVQRPNMIGALRWLSYLNPVRYAFEGLMSNEFHTIEGDCVNLVPQGPGYEAITLANQVCPVVGAEPGQLAVNGNQFIGLSFGYSYSNLWMNLGILFTFGVGFFALLLLIVEINTKTSAASSIVLYIRNSRTRASMANDEEKSISDAATHVPPAQKFSKEEKDQGIVAAHHDIFSWENLSYTVPIKDGQTRRLLDNVAGFVAPGKLTALMGESGAGKTTLLNVLAQRTDVGVVDGQRWVNGQALPRDFQSQTGYCQQQDTHIEQATVREALLFSAKLRQPASVSLEEKQEWVDKCLRLCGLDAYQDALVGTLNTENKKRTTIAVELAAKPALLLFLDEPTSGLDSQSAWAIVSFLRYLADNGQAILCTIHQPSAELFQVFDRLLLLRKGGQTVYFGDLGHHAITMINYFEQNGSRKCKSEENPAEFMLDVIGAGATAYAADDWNEIWRKSSECKRLGQELEKIHSDGKNRPAAKAASQSAYATSWVYQTTELLKRDWSVHYRDTDYLMGKIMLNISSGLFIGFTFFNRPETPTGTQNMLFAFFMATIMSIPLAEQLQIPFLHMRNIYEIRERPSRMYSWTALLTSQLLVELPWNFLGSSLFFFCWYWTVGFDTDRAGYSYLMICVIFPIYYTSIGQAIAAMSSTAEMAGILFGSLFSFVITFNGIMQPFRLLGWWKWMYYVSPYTYLIEGVIGQALGRKELQCSAVEFVTLTPPSGSTCAEYLDPYMSVAGGYVTNPSATDSCSYCYTNNTDQYLSQMFNITYNDRWINTGAMIGFCAFNILALFFLTYWFRIKTWSVIGALTKRTKRSS